MGIFINWSKKMVLLTPSFVLFVLYHNDPLQITKTQIQGFFFYLSICFNIQKNIIETFQKIVLLYPRKTNISYP